MAIEPVTREERFLAVAGGQSVTPPEPITRKEKLLKGIIDAVNSGGGNGSGGNAEDGFSPIATVEQTATGAVISITDKDGTTTATITNGKDGKDGADGAPGEKGDTGLAGYTPVKGTDYWTDTDKTDMLNDVLAALPTWNGGSY